MSSVLLRPTSVVGLAAVAGALVCASSAWGAGVAFTEPTAANGTKVQTGEKEAKIPIAWATDTAGCREGTTPLVRVETTSSRTSTSVSRDSFATPPTGSTNLTVRRPVKAPTTVTVQVLMSCSDANFQRIEAASEVRSFELLPPNLRPALMGKNRLSLSATLRYRKRGGRAARASLFSTHRMAVRKKCQSGPCTAIARISGIGAVQFRYNKGKRVWTGRFTNKQTSRFFTCRVGSRRFRGVTTGRLTMKMRVRRNSFTRVVGTQTRAMSLVGTISGRLKTNARGVRAGCPGGGPLKGTLRVSGS